MYSCFHAFPPFLLIQLNWTANGRKKMKPKKVSYIWISQSFRNLIISMFKRGDSWIHWIHPSQRQRRNQRGIHTKKVTQLIQKSLCELTLSMFKRSDGWFHPTQKQRRNQRGIHTKKVSQLIQKSLCELTLSMFKCGDSPYQRTLKQQNMNFSIRS